MKIAKIPCECSALLPLKAYFATIRSPYKCDNCNKIIYWNTSFSSRYSQLLFGIFLVIGFVLFLKQTWLLLLGTVVSYTFGFFVFRTLDLMSDIIIIDSSVYSKRVTQRKKNAEIVFLLILLLLLVFTLVE